MFLLASGFYLWTTAINEPLSLHDGLSDRYNLLATAFLHLRLSVGPAPAALLHLSNPYNPNLNSPLSVGANDATSINDDLLYHGKLYFEWGPAPAVVLLVPLHLLGFEPSSSVTVVVFAIAGVAFALATLRVLVRRIGGRTPIWMCLLAGLALSLSSAVPFVLHSPNVTMDTLAGGYCFAMAGVWLAVSALAGFKTSQTSLALMSLCFGLAANSRPTLALPALVLIPVYLSLRATRSRRMLLVSVAAPFCICVALLLAYNQARFNDPFEVGAHYQLAGYESRTAPLGRFGYLLPGARFYLLTAPQPKILFPFFLLNTPETPPPAGLAAPEATGGILPMTPVVIFIGALAWIWWRRRALLGGLAGGLFTLAASGVGILLLASYQFFASTERYEVDFATLFVLGGLAGWLSLSAGKPGLARRAVRVGGGALVIWGCLTGLATSFAGGKSLARTHPGTWRTLEELGSPLSTAVAAAVGHPVIAEVAASHAGGTAASYASLGATVTEFSLAVGEQAEFTIISPDAGRATLSGSVSLLRGEQYDLQIGGPGSASHSYVLPAGGGTVDLPVHLHLGLNRLAITPAATPADHASTGAQVVLMRDLAVGG